MVGFRQAPFVEALTLVYNDIAHNTARALAQRRGLELNALDDYDAE